MGKSVNTHIPVRCQLRRASKNAKQALTCLAPEGVNVNVANALATRREIAGFMAKHARVMTAAVKTWMVWSVEAMARVPVAAAFVREDGLESSANIPGSVI